MSLKRTRAVSIFMVCALASGGAFAECPTDRTTGPNPRFVLNGGEVYDSSTDLTWQRCSVGQKWSDQGCTGEVEGLTFDDASKRDYDGDWRLPTQEELESLISKSCKPLTIDDKVFPNMDITRPAYRTSTANQDGLAWLVYFNGGHTFNGLRSAPVPVRLVRTGK